MQDLSYDNRDPSFEFAGLRFSVQVFTFENVYGLDPLRCEVRSDEHGFSLTCGGLTWAGGQERAEGGVHLRARTEGGRTTFDLRAQSAHTIRCVKLTLHGVSRGPVLTMREGPAREVPAGGLNLRYPEGWRGLSTPLVALGAPEGVWYARSLDGEVREKRFALLPTQDGLNIELIFEELATRMGRKVEVPTWEVGYAPSLSSLMAEHARFVEEAHGLHSWDARPDVPLWARDVSLVAAIHGQHYSGYIFNDYAAMLRTIRWLAERLEGRRILAYLPGWEGRYYWQYGDYRPDERMGGAEDFARLCDGARELGVRVMPMFGMNVVNRGLPNFEQWGAPSLHATPVGEFGAGATVDWDGARHYNHGWGALLNPGAPAWQNRLVEQITGLADRYGFDGAFLDISAAWVNDARHDTFAGVGRLIERLRANRPEFLIAGEGWYDALSRFTPLVQSGHTDGELHHHDEPYAELFDAHARSFGHLCLGDPSRGSSGVHELGFNPIRRTPMRKGVIPTLTLVEDTLEKAEKEVLAVLDDARAYADRFLAHTAEPVPFD